MKRFQCPEWVWRFEPFSEFSEQQRVEFEGRQTRIRSAALGALELVRKGSTTTDLSEVHLDILICLKLRGEPESVSIWMLFSDMLTWLRADGSGHDHIGDNARVYGGATIRDPFGADNQEPREALLRKLLASLQRMERSKSQYDFAIGFITAEVTLAYAYADVMICRTERSDTQAF